MWRCYEDIHETERIDEDVNGIEFRAGGSTVTRRPARIPRRSWWVRWSW